MELIHTCYRITDPERSVAFYEALGLEKRRELPIRDEAVNYFLGVPGKPQPELELTYNFGVDSYELGTAYGHIALTIESMDDTLAALAERHRARAAAVLGARGRLAALLRPRPRRLPHRADRTLRLLTEPALRRPFDHTVATRRPSASAERGACACQFDNYIVVK